MNLFILSVCPQGNSQSGNYKQFSLRVDNPPESSGVTKVLINLSGIVIEVPNLTTYVNHGRVICKGVNEWIIFNRLNNYPANNPTRLIFTFNARNGGATHIYTLYQPQGV
jgi:hypothetical protein